MEFAMQSAPRSLRGRMFQQSDDHLKEQRILVLRTGVSGMKFHVDNDEERAALEALKEGDELILVREPDNQHDQWAIAVYLNETDKLGYVTRYKNETIARLMDAGKKFVAVMDDRKVQWDENVTMTMDEKHRTKQAPTENMSLPYSIYMVEQL